MVLCKHFQQGNCRFGSKCNFEHIDIKQLVKNDTESAINGKQYPFSCYGPFKDKPCIPNFIEDQSFEELRLLCYESKQKNCFDQFHNTFSMNVVDAMNKMKALMQPSYEIMNMLMMLYDSPCSNNNGGNNTVNASSNQSFGLNSAGSGSVGASIFGKSTIPGAQTGNNNVFGGSSIFGGGSVSTMPLQQGIFGGQNSFATQSQPQQSSIFGQVQQQQQQQKPGNSIFGGGVTAKPSIFGQQSANPTNGNNSFGLFGQVNNQQATLGFGQGSSFGTFQQQQPGSNAFGQNAFASQPPTTVAPFNQPQAQAQAMFAPSQQLQQQQPAQMGTNMFAQAATQMGQPSNFFQQTESSMSMGNVQQQQQQQQQQFSQSSLPQSQQPPTLSSTVQQSNSVYSQLADLTEMEIAAFKAEIFEPGKLPLSPPPLELIN